MTACHLEKQLQIFKNNPKQCIWLEFRRIPHLSYVTDVILNITLLNLVVVQLLLSDLHLYLL